VTILLLVLTVCLLPQVCGMKIWTKCYLSCLPFWFRFCALCFGYPPRWGKRNELQRPTTTTTEQPTSITSTTTAKTRSGCEA
jgi:hypothetical protein